MSAIIPFVRRTFKTGVCINELAGTYLAPNIPYGVSLALADKLHVPLESIPMPVLVKSEHARDIMLKEHMIRRALANAARVDIALVGLGTVSESSSIVRLRLYHKDQSERVRVPGSGGRASPEML